MPTISLHDYARYVFVDRIRQVPFLNYVDYDKASSKARLADEMGWRDYGGKHYESVWTRFFQGYYLPTKFGIDKRRAHLSTLICSGQIDREEALAELREPPYADPTLLEADRRFVLKKLGFDDGEWEAMMSAPIRSATDYPSNDLLFTRMSRVKNRFRSVATRP